jgi:hypothetical protein
MRLILDTAIKVFVYEVFYFLGMSLSPIIEQMFISVY